MLRTDDAYGQALLQYQNKGNPHPQKFPINMAADAEYAYKLMKGEVDADAFGGRIRSMNNLYLLADGRKPIRTGS